MYINLKGLTTLTLTFIMQLGANVNLHSMM